jgi:hypothetical protein
MGSQSRRAAYDQLAGMNIDEREKPLQVCRKFESLTGESEGTW